MTDSKVTIAIKALEFILIEEFYYNLNWIICQLLAKERKRKILFLLKQRISEIRSNHETTSWVEKYTDTLFYQLFRLQKDTFEKLLGLVFMRDHHSLLKKIYRGGNFPVSPEKAMLIFLWYMGKEDSLQSISIVFKIVASTVMKVVNVILYIIVDMKNDYIFWPQTQEEFDCITQKFSYPGAVGAVDGTHIKLKVPSDQHDSYTDRYQTKSINLMGIATGDKIFINIFVGFPGAAHDSRVFSNSNFVQNIEKYGAHVYFPNEDSHIIGDSAFPIKTWLMVPYRKNANLGRIERNHNYHLSSSRVVIENVFGILKGRWRRLLFINTYSVGKAVEIATAACVLHNFCYLIHDKWDGEIIKEKPVQNFRNNIGQNQAAKAKRDRIAHQLFNLIGN